ncbi:Uncharacterized conserved protein UCP033563 [Propionibacterium freudenreichii]|uniref:DUF1015 family protein n=1 Tax=Propionibacterium freudenreichii TaxID=1744 RepID=UPI000BC33C3B|nr:DUF1015 domain-containing protein [Propionibacterium freudenreichii]SBN60823.1 Uncharacterized conserved protein UCP033563 [Propionibacterium freudenreichii]SBN96347.1 Uncharacterized conserved protein UCP033563 [Propionibacterium freudenreichii]SBT30026.1 Uncharacterized conserved protein UCP033563 [Propionibacterium freudenreichii]SCC97932.1 Uncharacterized conserved protein UCP033563 [Propionibacterium freudenreichii]SCQ49753.1 Uncharacterized conserved protein UCP033563 [Propionibacteri
MPRFEPFAALRYAPSADLDKVIAPPYDVLSDADIDELEARDPHNIAWVDDPRGGDDRYVKAAALLRQWISEGVMVYDDQPSFTIYRMAFTDATGAHRVISGVLGGLEVVDEGAGGVLPHERTTKKAVTDRLDLTRATSTNGSPVWGLSLAHGLTDALAAPGEPVGEITVDGVRHSVERVVDPGRVAKIQEILAADDVLIADGHHRYSISRTYRDEVRKVTGRTDTPAEQTLAFVNELVEHQLAIEAIHRLVDGISWDDLNKALSRYFDIDPIDEELTPATLSEMVAQARLVLLKPDGTASWLIPHEGAFDDMRALDGAWLEKALGDTDAQVTYQHGLDEMRTMVADHAAGILIRPTSLTEIMRTAREGLLMPPKSTFFIPKLRTGFVLRPTASVSD